MNRISGLFAPMALAGALLGGLFAFGCSKKDDGKPRSGADTLSLPEQPPLPPIEDEFVEPDSAAAPSGVPADPGYGQVPNGYYVLQVKLFEKRSTAARYAENLKKSGIPAYVAEVTDPKPELRGTYYRVRAGSFATTAAARRYATLNLEPMGISGAWVDLKARDNSPVHEVYAPRPAAPPTVAPQPAAVPPTPVPAPIPVAPPAPQPTAPAPQAAPPAPPAPPAPSAPPAPEPAPVDTPHVEDW